MKILTSTQGHISVTDNNESLTVTISPHFNGKYEMFEIIHPLDCEVVTETGRVYIRREKTNENQSR